MIDQSWPPNFSIEFRRRIALIERTNSDAELRDILKAHYKNSPVDFIQDWCITYDPRAKSPNPKIMPFLLFPRQIDLIEFITGCLSDDESGLIEKCRDMGATWVCCALSVWLFLFDDGSSVGWGSRKEMLVDRVGDPDSIFHKMRMLVENLPHFLLPKGFNPKFHMTYMKCINPETGATITGEAGDNIGRGGRSKIYFKDESAHLEHPETVEAALSDNTDCQIDISSVNGPGNVFYRRRMAGDIWERGKEMQYAKTRIFIMDWRDHPGKDQAWYDKRRSKAEDDGLMNIFHQEVERDYHSTVEGVLIPGRWVKAAIGAEKKLVKNKTIKPDGEKRGGFDVATGEGGDVHALVLVHGIFVQYAEPWGDGDGRDATNKVDRICSEKKIFKVHFDSVGVGADAKATAKRLNTKVDFIPYNGAHEVAYKEKEYVEGKKNDDMFANKKAQDWWALRDRFKKTYQNFCKNGEYPEDELIIIPSDIQNRDILISELSQVTYATNGKGKIVVDKTPKGTKSPNIADALVMALSIEEIRRGPTVRIL